MFQRPLRYAISNRNGSLESGIDELCEQAAQLGQERVDFFQLREKDLQSGDLAHLARRLLCALRDAPTKLLIGGRADVAMAAGAPGVHLTGHPEELTPPQVVELYAHAGLAAPLISLSCHTVEEIHRLRGSSVDAILFGPVFEKSVAGERVQNGMGLLRLKAACAAARPIPVFALGGVTTENTDDCLAAGAAGIAGIRIFSRQ